MLHPLQCIKAVPAGTWLRRDLLVAAGGSRLFAYDSNDGSLISSWPQAVASVSPVPSDDIEHPPSKKPRFTSAEPVVKSESASKKHSRSNRVPTNSIGASVIKLAVSPTGQRLVAATDEDKSIKVFALTSEGQLSLLSERYMPKRPCALAITADEATIICCDKFGDVYGVPLHIVDSSQDKKDNTTSNNTLHEVQRACSKPSLKGTTVHTARNLQARENQLRDSGKRLEEAEKEFRPQLLLGHASMLTDLALATSSVGSTNDNQSRNYIITSDRDEHIRISRGLPQAHIIEGYCLGHKEFVSRICVPRTHPDILISGGGDDFLYVWKWAEAANLQKLDLKSLLERFIKSDSQISSLYTCNNSVSGIDESEKIGDGSSTIEPITRDGQTLPGISHNSESPLRVAVSGIWCMSNSLEAQRGTEVITHVLTACEGVSALFVFRLHNDGSLAHKQTLSLKGNALDIAAYDHRSSFIVSVDNIHKRCSTKLIRESSVGCDTLLQSFALVGNSIEASWQENILHTERFRSLLSHKEFERIELDTSRITSLLYNIETLRKIEFDS